MNKADTKQRHNEFIKAVINKIKQGEGKSQAPPLPLVLPSVGAMS